MNQVSKILLQDLSKKCEQAMVASGESATVLAASVAATLREVFLADPIAKN
jgi:hypothetical protein